MTSELIRVVLIDDSAVVRGALRQIIDAETDMRVVATASNGRLGLEELSRTEANIVLLDIEMPELDGLSTLPQILARHPGVRVIMASSLTQSGAHVTLEALALGAVDYITKPTSRAGPSALAVVAHEIVTKIRAIAHAGRRVPRVQRTSGVTVGPPHIVSQTVREPRTPATPQPAFARPRVIAIASSTGGPNALVSVLGTLPAKLTLPVLITQHMPPVFTALLAQRLERESRRPCAEARNGQMVEPGHVYIAPGDFHMIVESVDGVPTLRLTQTAPENHCRPSADPMLRSVASVYGAAVLTVVLTGMGEDGRRGCEHIRAAGGRIVVQDEATSVVWGMPGAVAAVGLAERILPLPEIGQRIGAICGVA